MAVLKIIQVFSICYNPERKSQWTLAILFSRLSAIIFNWPCIRCHLNFLQNRNMFSSLRNASLTLVLQVLLRQYFEQDIRSVLGITGVRTNIECLLSKSF